MNVKVFRLTLGFLLAPVFIALLFVTFTDYPEKYWIIKTSAMVGYPLAFVLGIPFYLLMNKFKKNGLVTYLISGVNIGSVIPLLFIILPTFTGGDDIINGASLSSIWFLSVFYTVLSVVVFWVIVRPDKSAF